MASVAISIFIWGVLVFYLGFLRGCVVVYWGGVGVFFHKNGLVVRISKLSGECNARLTIDSISFDVGGNRVINFLKPGNTNGSAVVGVLANCLSLARNGISVSNFSVVRCPRRTGGHVNCLPRVPPLCVSVGISRCLKFVFSLGGIGFPGTTRVGRIVGLIGVSGMTNHLVGGLSGNCHREMNFTNTLVNGPSMLVLSRPAINLSPGRVVRVEGLVSELNGGRAVVLSSRVLSRVRTIYGHMVVVGGNRVLTSSAPSDLSRHLSGSGSVITHVVYDRGSVLSTLSDVGNISGIASLNYLRPKDCSFLVRPGRNFSMENRMFGHISSHKGALLSLRDGGVSLRRIFLELARTNNCRSTHRLLNFGSAIGRRGGWYLLFSGIGLERFLLPLSTVLF